MKYKLKQLRGEEIPEVTPENRKILKEMNLTSEISKAREATYEYYRLKTDNGGKDSFTYTAGANRAAAKMIYLMHVGYKNMTREEKEQMWAQHQIPEGPSL